MIVLDLTTICTAATCSEFFQLLFHLPCLFGRIRTSVHMYSLYSKLEEEIPSKRVGPNDCNELCVFACAHVNLNIMVCVCVCPFV